MNKNVIDAKDFTLQESADSPHLAALAKHFQSTGKNVSVTAVLNSANRDLNQGHPSVGTGSPNEAWAWNSGDYKTTKWTPQGITSSADALGTGKWNDHEAWIVSWYQQGDSVRVSFVDRKTHKYRHVLLVYPSADDDFKSIAIHAGGIMWYGNLLYVVDTNNGIRAFDLDNIWEVETADGVGKMKDGKGYSADGYQYVLPQARCVPLTQLSPLNTFTNSSTAGTSGPPDLNPLSASPGSPSTAATSPIPSSSANSSVTEKSTPTKIPSRSDLSSTSWTRRHAD
jgi:hypothetical protein